MLHIACMARSTYYYELKAEDKVAQRDQELRAKILEIYKEHDGRYGVRRMCHELRNQGYEVNHKRVQRIMKELGLKGRSPRRKKYSSYKGDVGKIAPNVINRDFSADAPLEKITTDVTQFNLPWGKAYLAPVLDMYSNEVLAYNLSLNPNMAQVTDMLKKLFTNFPGVKGAIFHSDQGWQYQQVSYRKELAAHDIVQSMSRKGNCLDNAIGESFFGRLKTEMFDGHESDFESFEEFKKAIDDYIWYYNNKRIQSKTNWMTPVQFRESSIKLTA